jgi:hypothetical protein
MKIPVLSVLVALTSSCSYRENVPQTVSIDGCYDDRGSRVLTLNRGRFSSTDGSISGTFRRESRDQESFVIFKPAIHVSVAGNSPIIVRYTEMVENHLLLVNRQDRVIIRMPREPDGEGLLTRSEC